MANPESGLSPAEILYDTNLHSNSPLNPQEYKYINQSNPLTSKFVPDHLFLFLDTKIPKTIFNPKPKKAKKKQFI